MRIHSFAVVVAGLVALVGAEALACKCMAPEPSREGARARLDDSAAVFRGKVVSVAPFAAGTDERRLRITFDVSQAWKGVTRTRVDIATAGDTAACGIYVEVGREYLVFAKLLEDGDTLPVSFTANSCNGTSELSQVEESRPEWLAFLAETPDLTLVPVTASPATGSGEGAGSGTTPTAPVPTQQAQAPRAPESTSAGGCASCSSTGLGMGVLPLLALMRLLRRRRASVR